MAKRKHSAGVRSSAAEYLSYIAATGGDSASSFEIRYAEENIRLSRKMLAELYGITVAAINQHIKRIFDDGELAPDSVIKDYLITAADGKNYQTKHYYDYDRFLRETASVGYHTEK